MICTLLGIAIKPRRRAEMQLLDAAVLSVETGVAGDWRGRPGPRQVTLMPQSSWRAACEELGVNLPWTMRRANLLVDALPLHETTGARIILGEAVLEITGEADPCERMESAHPGLFNALRPHWRAGVTCRVVRGGPLTVGMAVMLVPPGGDV